MVKDLQYFLEEEDQFCNEHPNYEEFYIDEKYGSSHIGLDDPLYYLHCRIFHEYSEIIKTASSKENEFKLSDAQRVLLYLYFGKYSYIFRDDYYYGHITEFVQNLFDTLDDLVNKVPINSDSILYRFCNEYDKADMKVGDVITIPYNLTCTNYDWHQDGKNVYVISPLKNGKTKAHNLFEMRDDNCTENQIDFLRNTTFKVVNIENTEGPEFKKFFLEEV